MSANARHLFPKPVLGFTMVELLLVITTVGIISIVALPKFLDFRTEARVATAQNYINHARSALANKKTQMALRCGSTTWPRLEAILMNDITEGGAPGASCTPEQLPDGEERKFFAQASITPPMNPYNLLDSVVATSCTDFCSCTDEGGFLYNQSTGEFGHPLLLEECRGRLPASESSDSSESSSENASSESSELSEDSSSSGPCEPSYAMDEELNLCQDILCGEGYVDLSYCDGGSVSCDPSETNIEGECITTCDCSNLGVSVCAYDGQTMDGYTFANSYPDVCSSSSAEECQPGYSWSDAYNGGMCVCTDPSYASSNYEWGGSCECGVNADNCDGMGQTGVMWGYDPQECVNSIGECPSGGEGYGGCTDAAANNYDSGAGYDDGSCTYDEGYGGCTDGGANNYDSGASYDDGSCTYDDSGYGGCTDGGANNYDSGASYDDGSCTYDDSGYGGCTDGGASNYDSGASYDDGSCTYDEVYGGDSECPYSHNDGSCDSLPECPGLDYGNIYYSFKSGISGSTTFAYWGYTVTGCSTTVGVNCSCSGGSCTLSWNGSEDGGSGSISLYGDGCVRKDFLYQQ
ncbi:MAG: hypothetical protein R3A80_10720 [Bdellovibrionota bacterium]